MSDNTKTIIFIVLITICLTALAIFGFQFYRAINIKLPDPVPANNLLDQFVKSADSELEKTKEIVKEVETVVQYIPVKTYQQIKALPPDDLAKRALDRAIKFSRTISSDNP